MWITSTRGSSPFLLFLLLLLPIASLLAGDDVAGPVVRIENMTKLPGTDRGFPADDYFTFNKINRDINTRGVKLKGTNSQQMRIHNDGDRTLVITKLTTTYPDDFRLKGVSVPRSGLKIEPGKFVTVTVEFVTNEGRGKRHLTQELVMKSNAVNAKDVQVTFSGLYMTRPESFWEVDAQQIFKAFGFQTAMGKDKSGKTIVRPSSDYPTASQVNSGKEGDLIVSPWFEQADPNQPVQMLQLAAMHGPGGARTQLLGTGNRVLGGIDYAHGGHWHQSVFPRISNTSDRLAHASARRIGEPFKISIANYKSTGGTGNGSLSDKILGVRAYRVIDHNGKTVPNEYIILMDYIGTGCGEGSHNCDWNDNVAYLINARPVDRPSAKDLADQQVDPGKEKKISVDGAFSRGYPGNQFTFSASREGGGKLPSWISLNQKNGQLKVDAPRNAGGESYRIKVTATDVNRVKLTSSFNLYVGEASEPCVVDANRDGDPIVLECDEDEVRLSGYTSSGKYSWTGPGNFKSSERNPKVRRAGTYTLSGGKDCAATSKVTVKRETDCDDEEATNSPPEAVVKTSTTSGVAPLSVTLDGSKSKDSDGRIVSYRWTWPGGQADGKKNTLTLGKGTYKITLTVTDDRGAKDSEAITVRVAPAPPPPPSNEEVTYWLEAECATVGDKWSVETNNAASNGGYVQVRKGTAYGTPPADRSDNQLRFTIQSGKAGTYRLFARVLAPSGEEDSFYFRVNGGKWQSWINGLQSGKFAWREYSDGTLALKSGTNTVDIAYRESGTKIDKLYLTSGKTRPTGMGAKAGTCDPVAETGAEHWLEAECGNIGAGWTIESGSRASNGAYLIFKGKRSLSAPNNQQKGRMVTYSVNVSEAGTYHLFLRMNAPDYGKNSVWMRVDNGQWIKMWQVVGGDKLETSGFEWRKLNDDGKNVTFRLSPGKHTITLANRESGTKIDKIYLSQSAQAPSGAGEPATACTVAKALPKSKDHAAPAASSIGSMTLFPNPVANELTVQFTDEYTGEVELMIFDFNGKLVRQSSYAKPGNHLSARLNVSDLPSGMYQVRILTPGKPVMQPFVKQ